jgi:hypothetical protein
VLLQIIFVLFTNSFLFLTTIFFSDLSTGGHDQSPPPRLRSLNLSTTDFFSLAKNEFIFSPYCSISIKTVNNKIVNRISLFYCSTKIILDYRPLF